MGWAGVRQKPSSTSVPHPPPGMPLIYWFSRRMTLWGSISFNLAVFINIIIAFFYPYVEGASTGEDKGPVSRAWESTPALLRLGQSLRASQALRGPDAEGEAVPCTALWAHRPSWGVRCGPRDRQHLWSHGRRHMVTCTRTCNHVSQKPDVEAAAG